MIRAGHLRMARAGLGWNLQDLAKRSGVNANTISRFEIGRDILTGKLHRLEQTLREAGVDFLDANGVIGVTVPAPRSEHSTQLQKSISSARRKRL
jgi:transcriptional regulator with XRE-family HTH domain